MSNNKRILTLRTTDISTLNSGTDYYNTTVSNANGTVSQNRNSFLFNNVGIRDLFGNEYYEQFDKFRISLAQAYVGQSLTGIATALTPELCQAQNLSVWLSGIPFDAPVYIPSVGQGGKAIMGLCNLSQLPLVAGAGSGDVFNYPENGLHYTFSKTSTNVNLLVELYSNDTGTFPTYTASTQLRGQCVFTFVIEGIPKEETIQQPVMNRMIR